MFQSWKPEVYVDNQWAGNSLVFATKEEAEASAFDLMNRWTLVQDYRAVESEQAVNYRIDIDGDLHSVESFHSSDQVVAGI